MDLEDLKPLERQWLEANRERLVAEDEGRATRAKVALDALIELDRPLYAVLDAARDDRVLTVVRESVEEYRSLYEGIEGEALAHVAPYLVSPPKGSRLLRRRFARLSRPGSERL